MEQPFYQRHKKLAKLFVALCILIIVLCILWLTMVKKSYGSIRGNTMFYPVGDSFVTVEAPDGYQNGTDDLVLFYLKAHPTWYVLAFWN